MESKFKIGDVVVCIYKPVSKTVDDPNYPGAGYKLGHRFVVEEITNVGKRECLWHGYKGHGVYSDFVELADKVTPEMIKIPVKKTKKTKYFFK